MKFPTLWRVFFFIFAGACLMATAAPNASGQYTVTNLVANENYLESETMDSGLVDSWGIAAFPNSPFWVSAQNSSTSR